MMVDSRQQASPTSNNRPLRLGLLSESGAPARPVSTDSPQHPPSQSPFRYVQNWDCDHKPGAEVSATPLVDPRSTHHHPAAAATQSYIQPEPSSASRTNLHSASPWASTSGSRTPSPFLRQSSPLHLPSITPQSSYLSTRSYGHLQSRLRPWLPLILYGLSSLSFVIAIAFFRDQLFSGLDELSVWLRADKQFGHAVLFSLIFVTTIPPIPLYSTLIILSGYTFGPWTGAVISYLAALCGAIVVFVVSRTLLRESIGRWLDSTCTIKRVVRAIEKKPTLLFLIRLAPYPYNVMNCLLAAAPALTFRTYTVCTALSLFKVIIHTGVGASIHSFRDYHVPVKGVDGDGEHGEHGIETEDQGAHSVARMWTIIGVGLCVAIFVYLSIVARRAVDEELSEEDSTAGDVSGDGETQAFLSSGRLADDGEDGTAMVESSFRSTHLIAHMPRSPEPGSGRWM